MSIEHQSFEHQYSLEKYHCSHIEHQCSLVEHQCSLVEHQCSLIEYNSRYYTCREAVEDEIIEFDDFCESCKDNYYCPNCEFYHEYIKSIEQSQQFNRFNYHGKIKETILTILHENDIELCLDNFTFCDIFQILKEDNIDLIMKLANINMFLPLKDHKIWYRKRALSEKQFIVDEVKVNMYDLYNHKLSNIILDIVFDNIPQPFLHGELIYSMRKLDIDYIIEINGITDTSTRNRLIISQILYNIKRRVFSQAIKIKIPKGITILYLERLYLKSI